MAVAEFVNVPMDKKPFCSRRLLPMNKDATLLSAGVVGCTWKRVSVGFHASHFNSRARDWTTQEKTSAMSFKLLFHIEHHQAELKQRKRTLARHTCTRPTVQYTRAARTFNNVFLAASYDRCLKPGYCTGTRLLFPVLEQSEAGIPDFCIKKFSKE